MVEPANSSPAQPGQCLPPDDVCSPRVFFEQEFQAGLDLASDVSARVGSLVTQMADEFVGGEVQLGLMECLVNIVRHGYAGQAPGRVRVRCLASARQWCLTVTDQGHPIPADRLRQADGSVFDFDPDDLDALPQGGMGLSLIREVFDRVDYRSLAGSNQLLLAKFRRQRPA